MGVNEGTVCLVTGQKKLKDEYKLPNILLKINKLDMAGMMEAIKEYLKSHRGVVHLASAIWKTITVHTYGDYPLYVTPDDKMITRMLHLPSDKNKFLLDIHAQTV